MIQKTKELKATLNKEILSDNKLYYVLYAIDDGLYA
jgi:hypothetical protein